MSRARPILRPGRSRSTNKPVQFAPMRFVLVSRVKPFVRFTGRGKWRDPQAQEYLASKSALRVELRNQMLAAGWTMIPRGTRLSVRLICYYPAPWHEADPDNVEKTILDAASGIVYEDDRWVDELYLLRRKGKRLRVEMAVSLLEVLNEDQDD